MFSLDICRY